MGSNFRSQGKGSARRHMQVTRETFDNNWDKIFGSKKETKKEDNKDDSAKTK